MWYKKITMKGKIHALWGLSLFLFCAVQASAAGRMPPTILISGNAYFPISTLSEENGFQYHWDPLLQNAVVSGSGGSVKFHVGSEFILSRGKVVRLRDKVRLFKGSVLAPLAASAHLDSLMAAAGPSFEISQAELRGEPSFIPTHRIKKIVIDPGHGGRDFGAMSPGGIREKELVLEVGKMVRDELERHGIEIVMTRSWDVFIPLQERTRIANKKGADLFVSIHANASPSRDLSGFEVYYLSETTDDLALALERSENSPPGTDTTHFIDPNSGLKAVVWDMKEAENRRESIAAARFVADEVQKNAEISTRRIKSAQFFVLKWTECPSILVEMGYITHLGDESKIKHVDYRRRLAQGIADGILKYKAEYERTDGFTK